MFPTDIQALTASLLVDLCNTRVNYQNSASHLAWRPGAVIVGSGPHAGVVAGVAFAGDKREYVINTDAGIIRADVDASEPVAQLGENVKFDLPESSATIIRKPLD